MSDLTDKQAAQTIKITGSSSLGAETNYVASDSNGGLIIAGEGVAGTPAGGVLSIQGVAGGTAVPASQSGAWTVTANAGTNLNTSALALDTSVNGLLLSQASTTSGQKGPLIMGAVTTAAPTYTTAQTNPLSLTTVGALRVDASATTQPISAASLPLPTGAATSANQTTEITSLQLIDDVPHAQNAVLNKGIPAMGQLDDTSTTAATEDNVAVARITPQRAIHTNLRNQAGTEIGTVANPIQTNTNFAVVGGQLIPTITNKLRIEFSTTPSTIGSAYSTVFSRAGTGLFFGFQLDFNSSNVFIRLTMDSSQIFELTHNDILAFKFNDTTAARMQLGGFWTTLGNALDFSSRYAIPYSSSFLLEVKRSDGANHTLNNWMVILTEDS